MIVLFYFQKIAEIRLIEKLHKQSNYKKTFVKNMIFNCIHFKPEKGDQMELKWKNFFKNHNKLSIFSRRK